MLFYLNREDRSSLTPLSGTSLAALGWQEKDLENLVAQHIEVMLRASQLLVIHQERSFREEPDIAALDEDGRLHLFELKRWGSNEENLLQVLRYGQRFGRYGYEELDRVFKAYRQRIGGSIDGISLAEAHRAYFERAQALAPDQFNREQVFVVMTNGIDRGTREALAYWGSKGLPVRSLVYRVYETRGRDLLFEIEPYGAQPDIIDEEEEDRDSGLIVVNTNATYMPDAWRDMLANKKVSAFYGRKSAVDGINRDDPVALYHTRVGVIAIGRAKGSWQAANVGDDIGEEHFVPCEFDFVVEPGSGKAVAAWEINQYLRASHRFRQTVHTLPAAAADFIRKTLKDRA